MKTRRTDLAFEAHELLREDPKALSALSGVLTREEERGGLSITTVEVTTPQGAKALGKAIGRYVTLTFHDLSRASFAASARAIAAELTRFLSPVPADSPVLVAGLGNRFITPDAVGPEVHRHIFVTRHLRRQLPDVFGGVRPVASLSAEVLGNTGVESGEVVQSVCRSIRPACVIAVDALACRSTGRLCRTVQITDTGITPGSGVGNHRFTLDKANLGVPVIAMGVPTVVDAATLCADLTGCDTPSEADQSFMVTPRDIDSRVAQISRLMAYGINLALQPGMTVEDLELLLN